MIDVIDLKKFGEGGNYETSVWAAECRVHRSRLPRGRQTPNPHHFDKKKNSVNVMLKLTVITIPMIMTQNPIPTASSSDKDDYLFDTIGNLKNEI